LVTKATAREPSHVTPELRDNCGLTAGVDKTLPPAGTPHVVLCAVGLLLGRGVRANPAQIDSSGTPGSDDEGQLRTGHGARPRLSVRDDGAGADLGARNRARLYAGRQPRSALRLEEPCVGSRVPARGRPLSDISGPTAGVGAHDCSISAWSRSQDLNGRGGGSPGPPRRAINRRGESSSARLQFAQSAADCVLRASADLTAPRTQDRFVASPVNAGGPIVAPRCTRAASTSHSQKPENWANAANFWIPADGRSRTRTWDLFLSEKGDAAPCQQMPRVH